MNRRWIDPPPPPDVAGGLAEEFDLPFALAAALANRGLDSVAAVEGFLHPRLSRLSDPFRLPSMEAAVERAWRALDQEEPILVFGDYDVDGVCSTALVLSVLSELGGHVAPFVPNRISDGYGFTESAFAEAVKSFRPGLIITVDCGTQAAATVERAREEGIDVVVTDHHEPGEDLAQALALVNPKLGDDEATRDLAGVGVAFKFCHAMLKAGRDLGKAAAEELDLKRYVDLVALGTIADIVPLRGENRALARYGLGRLADTAWPGLRALLEVARVKPPVEAYHVGFQIGPRLNAAGRLGKAGNALELLLSEDGTHAQGLAQRLDAANRERQAIEEQILNAATDQLDGRFDPEQTFGVVTGGSGWHVGVVGIVASRLAQRFYRPSVVIGFDDQGHGRGSCRSIEGFDLVENLGACSDCLLRYGGHRMAAGLEIEIGQLEKFSERFNAVAAAALQGKTLQPSLAIDAWVDLADVDERMYEQLQRLRPFGYGNPTPTWASAGVRILQAREVGRGHLSMTVASGGAQCQAIGFNMANREVPEGAVDLAFRLKRNRYQGRSTLQLDVQDIRPA